MKRREFIAVLGTVAALGKVLFKPMRLRQIEDALDDVLRAPR